jgi:CBS domain-containing protein
MAKAKDVMTDDVVFVKKDAPIYEAARLLSLNDIRGIPVVDDEMHIVGIVTEKDMLDMYHVMQYANDRTVNTSMSREVVSFDVEDDLDDVCTCLRNSHFRRVPITSEGKLVGIISRRDLILHMLSVKQKNDQMWC